MNEDITNKIQITLDKEQYELIMHCVEEQMKYDMNKVMDKMQSINDSHPARALLKNMRDNIEKLQTRNH